MPPVTKSTEQATMNEGQKAKVTLYWLEKSRSQRILWLLEEAKIDYDIKTYKRQNMLAPPELKDVHPLGKAPILTIESANTAKPLVLAESGLMTEYLIDHFAPHLAPKRYAEGKEGQVGGETESWLRYRYYLHYVEGSLMPLLVTSILLTAMRSRSPFFVKPIVNLITGGIESGYLTPNYKTHFDFLESQIASSPDGGEYLCGRELSGADILMSFPLGAAKGRVPAFTQENHPKLWAYVERIEGLEANKRAVEKIVQIEGSYNPNL